MMNGVEAEKRAKLLSKTQDNWGVSCGTLLLLLPFLFWEFERCNRRPAVFEDRENDVCKQYDVSCYDSWNCGQSCISYVNYIKTRMLKCGLLAHRARHGWECQSMCLLVQQPASQWRWWAWAEHYGCSCWNVTNIQSATYFVGDRSLMTVWWRWPWGTVKLAVRIVD